GNPQIDLQDKGVIDNECSRHMTWNMSYLTDYEEINRGYVAFGGNPKGEKITGRAFKVFNNRTRIVEENLHIRFSENTPNIERSGPTWLFDIDALTKLINYKPVVRGNQSNGNAGTKECDDAGKARIETVPGKDYILLPLWNVDEDPRQESKCKDQEKEDNVNNTNNVNVVGTNRVNVVGANTNNELQFDQEMPDLEDISTFNFSSDQEDADEEAGINNMDTTIQVSPIPTTRIHKDHPLDQVIRDLHSTTQTRNMSKNLKEHGTQKGNPCTERSKLDKAMQEELLQFKLQDVWTLVDLPYEKRAIITKWVFRNKKDERGIMIRNKARLVAQGHIQEEGIDYDEVFTHVSRIEAIRLFLAYASFKDFVVYQMDVKSAFLYEQIEEEVYICQPSGFEDPNFPGPLGFLFLL
nr:putative ribonuclease H-like domain-containing protein [Tanacetum cinerariifolium]